MTTLPTSLVRFRGELETAVEREQQSRRRRRRVALRVAVVAGAAAVLAAGALAALPGDPGRLVEPASAAQRAVAALAATPGSVVHIEMLVEQRNPDGSRTSWRTQSWQKTTQPYEQRQIVTAGNGEPAETATVGGRHQLYDPQSNTIRIFPAGETVPGATPQPATAQPLREQVLDLLRSGKLTQSGRSTVGGRETISFAWSDGHTRYEYTVVAGTYDPVRWRFSPTDVEGGTTITFKTYEILPADQAPLDLTHHHPDAAVQKQPS